MPVSEFDHEKLDGYRLQLQFVAWASDLFDELRELKHRRIAETLDQLDRASLSVLLNIAEGNGRRALQQRARFFDDARGSATECAACLDALVAKRAADAERTLEGKTLLLRVVSILSKLVERFSTPDTTETDPRTSRRTRTSTI